MNPHRNALVIRYDEETGKLKIYDESDRGDVQEMPIVEFELATLAPMGLNGAAQWIGEPLLFLLSGTRSIFFGSDQQLQEEHARDLDALIESLEILAGQAVISPEQQFELAMLYLSRGRTRKSVSDITTVRLKEGVTC